MLSLQNLLIVARKAKDYFWMNSTFTKANDNLVDCNIKKWSSLLEKRECILLLGQYDNYDPFNDPFTAIIIENDNALVDWLWNDIFCKVWEMISLKSFEPNYLDTAWDMKYSDSFFFICGYAFWIKKY